MGSPDALVRGHSQSVRAQPSQYLLDDLVVFLDGFSLYQEVVHVGKEAQVNHIVEDMIHHVLEGGWRIG